MQFFTKNNIVCDRETFFIKPVSIFIKLALSDEFRPCDNQIAHKNINDKSDSFKIFQQM